MRVQAALPLEAAKPRSARAEVVVVSLQLEAAAKRVRAVAVRERAGEPAQLEAAAREAVPVRVQAAREREVAAARAPVAAVRAAPAQAALPAAACSVAQTTRQT